MVVSASVGCSKRSPVPETLPPIETSLPRSPRSLSPAITVETLTVPLAIRSFDEPEPVRRIVVFVPAFRSLLAVRLMPPAMSTLLKP